MSQIRCTYEEDSYEAYRKLQTSRAYKDASPIEELFMNLEVTRRVYEKYRRPEDPPDAFQAAVAQVLKEHKEEKVVKGGVRVQKVNEKRRKKAEDGQSKDMNPCKKGTSWRVVFCELLQGGTEEEIIKRIGHSFELAGMQEKPRECLKLLLSSLGEEKWGLGNWELSKQEHQGMLKVVRIDQNEGGGEMKAVKKQVKKQVRKPVKAGKKVEVKVQQNGRNPFAEGSGIFICFEELQSGGLLKDIVKRVKVRYGKEKPASANPEGRVKHLIGILGTQENVKGFKIKTTGKDIFLVKK